MLTRLADTLRGATERVALPQRCLFCAAPRPREGICALQAPAAEFFFDLLDERVNEDGLDDRLFRLSELPPGSMDKLLAALAVLGGPAHLVWVPMWKFPSQALQQQAERCVGLIRDSARPTALVISTRDMEEFRGCWRVERSINERADWFAALNIP